MLSQRFDCVPGVDAFEVYRALRIVNPSPYMYFLRFGLEERAQGSGLRAQNSGLKAQGRETRPGSHHIVGSSPELLVRVHGRDVEYLANCGHAAAECG